MSAKQTITATDLWRDRVESGDWNAAVGAEPGYTLLEIDSAEYLTGPRRSNIQHKFDLAVHFRINPEMGCPDRRAVPGPAERTGCKRGTGLRVAPIPGHPGTHSGPCPGTPPHP